MPRPVISKEQREADERHMARCLELARRFEGRTAPNPIVGCVIVDRWGKVLAEGAHAKAGTAHAEIVALANAKKAGAKVAGATLYVNLEPCNHTGRTGPCAPVVRDSGIERVVIGMEDPVPSHGGGIELLRRAKLEVHTGVLRAQCERANLAWTTFVTHQRPAFSLKAAITLDGKIATVTGHSKYVTGEAARADVMRLRNTHDAIMVGIGTVLADDPWLTVRGIKGDTRDPIRIVLDSDLRTPPDAHVLARGARTIIVCGPDAPAKREKELIAPARERGASRGAATGIEVWRVPTHANGRLDVAELARRLAGENIMSVLVEGGGEVHAYMIEKRLCDLVYLYIAPKVIGGPAKSWVGGKGLEHMGSAVTFV
ncbi:MAG: bifunctional diaminohydroxyphosphoribosylaminopyrimidine deaminase/5-amino-6-(5-phosphoribosylamino)uracil reductase RibD, partial [Kofleriaceae bacterium]